MTFLGRTDGRTTRTTGISVLGIGTGDGDRRRRRWHNTTAQLPPPPPSLARPRLPEEGGDGRGDDDVHCPAPERAVQWRDLRLHRAPHYPPINSQTRSLLLVSLTAPLYAPLRPSVRGRKEAREGDGRGVQNKSCLKSGKSLAGISDPAASVVRPSVRLLYVSPSIHSRLLLTPTMMIHPAAALARPPAPGRLAALGLTATSEY